MNVTESTAAPGPGDVPNAARIYNYTLGGTHWLPVDQAAAEYMFSLVPSTPQWVRMLRDFLQEAAIYPDVDPYTLEVARQLVGNLLDVLYLQYDVFDARALLESPRVREFLGGERRVAFGASGITVFLSPDEIRRLFHDLYDWAAPGSRLYVTYETKEPGRTTPQMEQFVEMSRQAGSPFWMYSLEESIELSRPWRIPGGAGAAARVPWPPRRLHHRSGPRRRGAGVLRGHPGETGGLTPPSPCASTRRHHLR